MDVHSAEELREQLMKMLNRLEEITRCQVCLSDVGKSVLQCMSGHGICVSCRKQLNRCPTCKEQFLPHKPTLLCQVLEALPRLCPHNTRGCKTISLISEHQQYCGFRPIECKISKYQKCTWSGLAKDLKSHAMIAHNGLVATYSIGTSKKFNYKNFKGNWSSQNFYHIVDNNLFLLSALKDTVNQKFVQAVRHIPINSSGSKFTYYFNVSFAKTGNSEFVFKQPIKACLLVDQVDQFEVNPYNMITPIEELDRFVNNVGSLEVFMQVFKVAC